MFCWCDVSAAILWSTRGVVVGGDQDTHEHFVILLLYRFDRSCFAGVTFRRQFCTLRNGVVVGSDQDTLFYDIPTAVSVLFVRVLVA